MISYDPTTNMATYTCVTGYTISGATPITCMSDGTTSAGAWSPTPAVTCAREYCIPYFLYLQLHPNKLIYILAEQLLSLYVLLLNATLL